MTFQIARFARFLATATISASTVAARGASALVRKAIQATNSNCYCCAITCYPAYRTFRTFKSFWLKCEDTAGPAAPGDQKMVIETAELAIGIAQLPHPFPYYSLPHLYPPPSSVGP